MLVFLNRIRAYFVPLQKTPGCAPTGLLEGRKDFLTLLVGEQGQGPFLLPSQKPYNEDCLFP